MSEWTPGPWFTLERGEADGWFVDGAEGQLVAGHVNYEADARLIAAAPEMAELLDELTRPDFLNDPEVLALSQAEARSLLDRIAGKTQGPYPQSPQG